MILFVTLYESLQSLLISSVTKKHKAVTSQIRA